MSDTAPFNLGTHIAGRASRHPDRRALVWLGADGKENEVLSYGELSRRADALARVLVQRELPGERVVMAYSPGLAFPVALLACLRAGVIAAPVSPPRRSRHRARFNAVVRDGRVQAILTDGATAGKTSLDGTVGEWPVIVTDQCPVEESEVALEPESDVALIQYTSGSTGRPRGVVITHENLQHNQESIRQFGDHDETSIYGSWLPMHHDMGLMCLLQSLFVGGTAILMAPNTFLQNPVRWLKAIGSYRITTGGGPGFAYDLCVKSISDSDRDTLDLTSWKTAVVSADYIHAATLDRFVARFGACGFSRRSFYPCYGMAEVTLMATGVDWKEEPVVENVDAGVLEREQRAVTGGSGARRKRLVGCGRALTGLDIRIVDPSSARPLDDGVVGEIWIGGKSVGREYFGDPEETERNLRAKLSGEGGVYLRSGDLGYVRDGELFVTGRLKDVVIVRGVNYAPHDLEESAAGCHESILPGSIVVFTIPSDGEERIVFAAEAERTHLKILDSECVARAVQKRIHDDHGLTVEAVVLLRPGGVPRTTSGKIQRNQCRISYLAGDLPVVGSWQRAVGAEGLAPERTGDLHRAEAIESWIISRLASELRLPQGEISPELAFGELGLDSALAVSLSQDLADWLGRDLETTIFFEHPTIRELVAWLAADAVEGARSA